MMKVTDEAEAEPMTLAAIIAQKLNAKELILTARLMKLK